MADNEPANPRDLLITRTLVDTAVVALASTNHPAAWALKALREQLNRECRDAGIESCFTTNGSTLAADTYIFVSRKVP